MSVMNAVQYTISPYSGPASSLGFNSGVPDGSGVEWYLEQPPGWGGASVRRAEIPLALRDGVRRVPMYYGTRDMTLNGQIYGPTRDLIREGWRKLAQLTDEVSVLFLASEATALFVDCQLNGESLINWHEHGLVLEFSVPMVATDPLKYSITQTETLVPGVAETLVNAGDKDTYPIIVITASGATITDVEVQNLTTGVTMHFTGIVTSGNKLYADVRALQRGEATAKLTVNAVEGEGPNFFGAWASPRDAMYLAPGNNSIKLVVNATNNAAHRLEMRWRHAWR